MVEGAQDPAVRFRGRTIARSTLLRCCAAWSRFLAIAG